ncbi:MAG: MFS transporter, partial [Alphaproteobacteria bacterium]
MDQAEGPRWLGFAAACLAIAAVGENSTAIMAALPAMARAFGLDASGTEWLVNAYLLASASFIVLGGEGAGRMGAGPASAVGATLFGLASAAVALLPDGGAVIAARAVQGLGAAFAVAGTLALVTIGADEGVRALRIGTWTGSLMLGFSIGPLLGGALTLAFDWRAVFWLNAALMLVAVAGLAWRHRAPARPPPAAAIDGRGFLLLAGFMVAVTFGIRALPQLDVAAWSSLGPLAAAAALLVALVLVERRLAHPFFVLAFLAHRRFALAMALGALSMFNILSLLLYYNLYAQAADGLGMSAVRAGLSLVPLSVTLFVVARLAPRLVARFGLRVTMLAGALLTAAGAAAIDRVIAQPVMLALAFVVMGAGLALPYASAPRMGLMALAGAEAA